jgi:hypothetical protein
MTTRESGGEAVVTCRGAGSEAVVTWGTGDVKLCSPGAGGLGARLWSPVRLLVTWGGKVSVKLVPTLGGGALWLSHAWLWPQGLRCWGSGVILRDRVVPDLTSRLPTTRCSGPQSSLLRWLGSTQHPSSAAGLQALQVGPPGWALRCLSAGRPLCSCLGPFNGLGLWLWRAGLWALSRAACGEQRE